MPALTGMEHGVHWHPFRGRTSSQGTLALKCWYQYLMNDLGANISFLQTNVVKWKLKMPAIDGNRALYRMPRHSGRKNWATRGHRTQDTGQDTFGRSSPKLPAAISRDTQCTVVRWKAVEGSWDKRKLRIRAAMDTRIVSICAPHWPFPAPLLPCQKHVLLNYIWGCLTLSENY